MTPDELAELEDERRFLLRSLEDLDREHEAGDVDDTDYAVLRDGYTARAATVLRAIDAGRAALPPPRRTPRRIVAMWVAGAVMVAVGAGWLVARSSGQRLGAGDSQTTEVTDVAAALVQARAAVARGSLPEAAELYREALTLEPGNSEARTYIAWILALSAEGASEEAGTLALDQARDSFEAVIAADPAYADAHCLYAVMAARILPEPDLELARREGEACLANDPPGEMVQLVEAFVESL